MVSMLPPDWKVINYITLLVMANLLFSYFTMGDIVSVAVSGDGHYVAAGLQITRHISFLVKANFSGVM